MYPSLRWMPKHKLWLASLLVLMILAGLFLLLTNRSSASTQPVAQRGVLDLSGWNWADRGVIALNGDWEFYPNQLLEPDEFQYSAVKPQYLAVPSSWGKQSFAVKMPSHGYGTYRLTVKHSNLQGAAGLKKMNIRSSARIFAGGEEIIRDGMPDRSGDTYVFSNVPALSYFQVDAEDLEIVIQVANYDYFQGGISGPIYLGTKEALSSLDGRSKYLNVAIQVVLLVIGLVYLLLFLLVKQHQDGGTAVVSFGFLCLALAMSFTMRQERILYLLLPQIPYGIGIRLLFFAVICITALVAILIWSISPYILSKLARNVVLAACVVYLLLLAFLPFSDYSNFIEVQLVANAVFFFWLLVRSLSAFLGNQPIGIGRFSHLLLILSLLALNVYHADASLFGSGIKYDFLISTVSIFIFAVSLVFVMVADFAETERKRNFITQRLALQEKEIMAHENAFLRSQINPHFLFNTLTVIQHFQESDSEKASNLLGHFGTYLRNSFDFEASELETTVEKEIDLIKAYLTIQQSRFMERLKVEWNLDEELLHHKIPALSLEPLVENAVQHGILTKEAGGTVRISVTRTQDGLQVEVCDDGVGMSQETIYKVLSGGGSLEQESHGIRKGIGINNIQQRLTRYFHSRLHIESEEGKGTRTWFVMEESPC